MLERYGGSEAVELANVSNLEGRYITCTGIEQTYKGTLSNGSATTLTAGEEWPTSDVIVQVSGQKTTSSTVMDLQGVPKVKLLTAVTSSELDFDTSGTGQAVLSGNGFGWDARDVEAVVFGPWRTSGIGAEEDMNVL